MSNEVYLGNTRLQPHPILRIVTVVGKLDTIYTKEAVKNFALGNEALSRGLVEAGLQFATCYPGTPTSEIIPIMSAFSRVMPELQLYTEWSTNEAVALEVASAAAQTGIRCAFAAKHVGLNVAMDAFMTLSYSGVIGGLVLIIGDDPELHSSQNEQDTRYLARAGSVPVLEPATAEEAYSYAKLAFELSEQFQTPVILRITTRVAHARQIIQFSEIVPQPRTAEFKRDIGRLVNVPSLARKNHLKLIEKWQKLTTYADEAVINVVEGSTPADFGVVAVGVGYNYVKEGLRLLARTDVPIFKLGLASPLPEVKLVEFLTSVKHVLVVEEVEPILEMEVRAIAQANGVQCKIEGKREGYTPYLGELNTQLLLKALQPLLGVEQFQFDHVETLAETHQKLLPNRPPVLCAGCPHRSSFHIIKKALGRDRKEALYLNDIGCYALGLAAPANVADMLLCMGASISMSHGMAHTGMERPAIAVIGDSTFWHTGLPGLANAVYNGSDILILVVDNLTTAMTGMQGNPSTGQTALGVTHPKMSIEAVTQAMGAPTVVIDPWEVDAAISSVKDLLAEHKKGPKVVISRRECITDALRRAEPFEAYVVNQDECIGCGICVDQLGCPAIVWDPATKDDKHPKPMIDATLCAACSVCAQLCPRDAITGSMIQYKTT